MRILVLGGSYTGRHLARWFSGVDVSFLSRDPDRLMAQGFVAAASEDLQFDGILDTVPATGGDGDAVVHPWHTQIGALLDRRPTIPIVHISSTSVFGEEEAARSASAGPPVMDEESPCRPLALRGQRRLALEMALRKQWPQLRILRAGGIYGPGRSVAARFLAGDFSRVAVGNLYVSRIHVHDLCRLSLALLSLPVAVAPHLVHAVDRRPCTNAELFSFLERTLSIRIPGDWRTQTPTGRIVHSRYRDAILPGGLVYPDYRSGMLAALSADE